MNHSVQKALEKIDFVNRYQTLVGSFTDYENSMEDVVADEVLALFQSTDVSAEYDEDESFFAIEKRRAVYRVQINMILKYGLVQLILVVRKNGRLLKTGGDFSAVCRLLGATEVIKDAAFTNYSDLRQIVKAVLQLMDDLAEEL